MIAFGCRSDKWQNIDSYQSMQKSLSRQVDKQKIILLPGAEWGILLTTIIIFVQKDNYENRKQTYGNR